MATIGKHLGFAVLNVGALVAALGLNSALWQVALANTRGTVSRAPFTLSLLVAYLAVAMLRRPSISNAVLATAVRRSLVIALPMLLLCLLSTTSGTRKEAVYVAAMRYDLRDLADLEARVYSDSGHYTPGVGRDFHPSQGIAVAIIRASAGGWSATASHSRTARRCAIYVGPQTEPPAQRPGEPACTGVPVTQTMRRAAPGLAALVLGLALATAGARAWAGRLRTP